MFASQPSDCDFLEVSACIVEKWVYDLLASLKAKGLSVNFGNVTTSRDVSLMIEVHFPTMSDLWWFNQ